MSTLTDTALEAAGKARAWPFEEARRLVQRFKHRRPEKGYVLFETGYGPSGLPHLGTFGEVVRTSWVQKAFETLSDIPTRLVCFSDDMDGLRKVPGNVKNTEILKENLGKPLTAVPDPFGTHSSFGEHNNARLTDFLDSFGFEYSFLSATQSYREGQFDEALLSVLERYEEIMAIMLPTLGPERRATYSPFMPISPSTGRVLQVPLLERHPGRGTVVFEDEDGRKVEQKVTGGLAKLQWRPAWALRWYALGVDYEMSGKDLIDSVKIAGRITKVLGGRAPEGMTYELFLDEEGHKISKSRGNGLSMEDWLAYAPSESLEYYLYHRPKTARKLSFSIIPKSVDDYLVQWRAFFEQGIEKQFENPLWHIHAGQPPKPEPSELSFTMLLNLASVVNAEQAEVLWGFIQNYAPGLSPENAPFLSRLVNKAVAYYRDFVRPAKAYKTPEPNERDALNSLAKSLEELAGREEKPTSKELQSLVYSCGKAAGYDNLRDWFSLLYQVLLGQDQGPRMGTFISLYGEKPTLALIRSALKGELASDSARLSSSQQNHKEFA